MAGGCRQPGLYLDGDGHLRWGYILEPRGGEKKRKQALRRLVASKRPNDFPAAH